MPSISLSTIPHGWIFILYAMVSRHSTGVNAGIVYEYYACLGLRLIRDGVQFNCCPEG